MLKNKANLFIIHLESSEELAEEYHKMGGAVEHDEILSEQRLRQMFDNSRFIDVSVEDHPGFYLARATNFRQLEKSLEGICLIAR